MCQVQFWKLQEIRTKGGFECCFFVKSERKYVWCLRVFMPGTVCTHTQIRDQVCSTTFLNYAVLHKQIYSAGEDKRLFNPNKLVWATTFSAELQIILWITPVWGVCLITDLVTDNSAKQCSNILIITVLEIHYKIKSLGLGILGFFGWFFWP